MLTPGFYDSAILFTFGGLVSHFPAYTVRVTGSGGRRGAVKHPLLSEGTILSIFISKSMAAEAGDALSRGGKKNKKTFLIKRDGFSCGSRDGHFGIFA